MGVGFWLVLCSGGIQYVACRSSADACMVGLPCSEHDVPGELVSTSEQAEPGVAGRSALDVLTGDRDRREPGDGAVARNALYRSVISAWIRRDFSWTGRSEVWTASIFRRNTPMPSSSGSCPLTDPERPAVACSKDLGWEVRHSRRSSVPRVHPGVVLTRGR